MVAKRARTQGIVGYLMDVNGPVGAVRQVSKMSRKAKAKLPTEIRLCPCCAQKLSRHTTGPYCLRCSRWCDKCRVGSRKPARVRCPSRRKSTRH